MSITKPTDRMRAKIDSVCVAHEEWQRGSINEREYLRRADITEIRHVLGLMLAEMPPDPLMPG